MIKSNELLQRKNVFEYIQDSFKDSFSNDNREEFSTSVKKLIYNTNFDNSQIIKDHITWVKNNQHLRISDNTIPQNIVSNQNDSILHDIKVHSKGPDDVVFDKNADIRSKIARGNTILEYTINGKKEFDLIIYALRKFSGGLGDEDDVDRNKNDWKNYFLKDVDNTKYIISLQKANGEAAHMSCRYINDDFVICAGSKNVHLIFKKKEDLMEYNEPKFLFAKIIAETVLKHLDKMNLENKKMYLSFLCWTRLTVIFEILNPKTQHVEDLSYLKEPLLKFITFTENKLYDKPDSLCCLPPEVSIEIGKLFELSCVDCTKIPYKEVEEYLTAIRKEHGYEGVVLYFLDSEYNVIGLLKKKTTWYIIVRAIREKLRSYISTKTSLTLVELQKRVANRLASIKNWIGFSDKDLENWQNLAIKFTIWFDNAFRSNLITRDDYSEQFPVLWNRFLTEWNTSDHIKLTILNA